MAVLAAWATAAALGSTPAAISQKPSPRAGRIVVLGDSLAVSPNRDQAFPALLQERLRRAGWPWTVVNAGVRGDTTTRGLRRVDRLLSDRPDILILALGSNDGLRATRADVMSQNLEEIIRRAKAAGARVLLCGVQLPEIPGWAYGRTLRNVFSWLADEHDLPLVPYLLDGVALNREMNGPDGIHPNAVGARRIADNVWPHLEPMVRAGLRGR
ncbi:MAG: arylesterase [Acidobacteriota bacterium]